MDMIKGQIDEKFNLLDEYIPLGDTIKSGTMSRFWRYPEIGHSKCHPFFASW